MRRILGQVIVVIVGAIALVGLGGVSTLLEPRQAVAVADSTSTDTTTLAGVKTQLADARRELARTHEILEYATRYSIAADLATQIYDVAVAEGIPVGVGFQLVRVESGFTNTAQSGAAAIGLTRSA